jgi:hypothetical protein
MKPTPKNDAADRPLFAPDTLVSHLPSPDPGQLEHSRLTPAAGYKFQFDFDIGHLLKSPCRVCTNQPELPRCADSCRVLDRLHTVLSKSISCANRR